MGVWGSINLSADFGKEDMRLMLRTIIHVIIDISLGRLFSFSKNKEICSQKRSQSEIYA